MALQSDDDVFTFRTQIRTVAVIGAGISGIASTAHLLRQGLDVTVFERSSVPGGVWHYDPTLPPEPPYPNDRPPAPATPDGNPGRFRRRTFKEVSLEHAPPGPCYNALRNNIPTPVMRTTLLDWPEGTPDYISHDVVEKYIRDLAVSTGVQERIQYNTRVEAVWKSNESDPDRAAAPRWTIRTQTLQRKAVHHQDQSDCELVPREWSFDAVVVASGRYHEPRIPALPGLKEWKQRRPDSVLHSKQYRSPEPFRDKTVLLVGGGVSALDIAGEIVGVAGKTYQSARGGKFDLPAAMFAPGVARVGPVARFVLDDNYQDNNNNTVRRSVILQNGLTIPSIDTIILCTGYITTYPFLARHLQAPTHPPEQANDKVIITADGCTTHNLHKDLFYIPDPSLAFVGVPYHASAFSLFDFQAAVVARVFAGKARLPSRGVMRAEYGERKAAFLNQGGGLGGGGGGGAAFHSLMRRDVEYTSGLQGWVNREAVRLGYEVMDGIDGGWEKRYFEFVEEMKGKRWEDDGRRGREHEVREVPLVGKEVMVQQVEA